MAWVGGMWRVGGLEGWRVVGLEEAQATKLTSKKIPP